MNKLVIALIALVVVAGGVGGVLFMRNGGESAAAGAPETGDLAGTSWILEQITDADGARPAESGAQVTLDFGTDGRVTGNASCNRYFGPYTQDGATLSVGMLASTMMACEETLMTQEQAFMAALGAAERAQIDGDTLIISGADGVELRFTRA